MLRFLLLSTIVLLAGAPAAAEDLDEARQVHAARFGAGGGPRTTDGVHHLLDAERTPGQSNAIAFDRTDAGAFEQVRLRCRLRVLEGGDGGAFLFLSTVAYGPHGPAPFAPSWVEPNLRGSFAVGIDVHNPLDEEPFGPGGNYEGRPQREVSLHWDGREIVKRVAPAEFRGAFAACRIAVDFVVGGAEVTVALAGAPVYERYFVPGMTPYEMRLAIGAGTRADATTAFDVGDLAFETAVPAEPRRPPLHVELFNHVLTDNQQTAYETEVALPPLDWAFGRVILTLEIHDAGPAWDEWDRGGELSVFDDEGVKRGIVPFITSYRTPCHWEVDVTHFRPWLSGTRRFEIRAGTTFYKNRGYMMSAALDFHHGTPGTQAYRIEPLWHGRAQYGTPDNHYRDFFTPQRVAIDEAAASARLFLTTTGHSQVGEFTPARRAVVFVPDAAAPETAYRFEDVLWRTDCYLNPNRPQFGTWKYARAGWAPGDVVRPWWIDLSPFIEPGTTAEIRYEPEPYDFGDTPDPPTDAQVAAARLVVRGYLILERSPEGLRPAPTLRVTSVAQGSNAAQAGMQAGDYLARYDGRQVDTVDDLRAAMQGAVEAGRERVPVVVFRGGRRRDLGLAPGRMGINLAAR